MAHDSSTISHSTGTTYPAEIFLAALGVCLQPMLIPGVGKSIGKVARATTTGHQEQCPEDTGSTANQPRPVFAKLRQRNGPGCLGGPPALSLILRMPPLMMLIMSTAPPGQFQSSFRLGAVSTPLHNSAIFLVCRVQSGTGLTICDQLGPVT